MGDEVISLSINWRKMVVILLVVGGVSGSLFDLDPDPNQGLGVDNGGGVGLDASLAASKSLDLDKGKEQPNLILFNKQPPPPPPPQQYIPPPQYAPHQQFRNGKPCKRDLNGQEQPASNDPHAPSANSDMAADDDNNDDGRDRRAVANIEQAESDFKKFLDDNKVILSKQDEDLIKKFKEHQLAQKKARSVPEQPGQNPTAMNASDAQQQQARNVMGGPGMGQNMGQPVGQHMGQPMGQNMGQNMGGGMNMGGDMGHMMHARGVPEQAGQPLSQINASDAQQQQARNVMGGPGMGQNMGQPMGQHMGQPMGQPMGQNMGGGMNMGGDMNHMMHTRRAPEQPGQNQAPVNATEAQQHQARNAGMGMGMGGGMGGHQMGMSSGMPQQPMGGAMGMDSGMGHMMHTRGAPEQPGQNQAPVNATEAQQRQARNAGMGMGGGMMGGHQMGVGSGMPQQPMGMDSGMGHMMHARGVPEQSGQNQAPANATEAQQPQVRNAGMGMGMGGGMMGGHQMGSGMPQQPMGMDTGMGHMMHTRAAPAQPIAANATDAQQHQQQVRSAPDQVSAQAPNATQDHQQQARSIPEDQQNQAAPNGSEVHLQHVRALPLAQANQSQDVNREARFVDKLSKEIPQPQQVQLVQPNQPYQQHQDQRPISPRFGRMADQIMGYFQ